LRQRDYQILQEVCKKYFHVNLCLIENVSKVNYHIVIMLLFCLNLTCATWNVDLILFQNIEQIYWTLFLFTFMVNLHFSR